MSSESETGLSLSAAVAQLGDPDRGAQPLRVVGARGSIAALVIGHLASRPGRDAPLLVLCRDEARAEQLAEEIQAFWRPPRRGDDPLEPPGVQLVPEVEASPYSDLAADRGAIMDRLAQLLRLLHGLAAPVLVLSVRSLLRQTLEPEVYDNLCDLVGSGQEVERDDLLRTLDRAGYRRLPLCEDPGTYAVRGGVVDLHPPVYPYPIRVELDGDEVVSLRQYDPVTQLTMRPMGSVYIHPARETVVTAAQQVRERLLAAADRADHPSSRTRFLLEQIAVGADFFGSEHLVSLFHQQLAPLWSFLGASDWILEEPDELRRQAESLFSGWRQAYEERLHLHQLAVPPEELFVSPEALDGHLQAQRRVLLTAVDDAAETDTPVRLQSRDHAELARGVRRLQAESGQAVLTPLAEAVRRARSEDQPVVLISPGERSGERLRAALKEHAIPASLRLPSAGYALPGGAGESPGVEIRLGHLARGFTLLGGPMVIAEEELFGPKVRRQHRRVRSLPEVGDLAELKEGDCVVHQLHGVGRYEGLRREVVRGVVGDFMLIAYQGSDKLFLPVHRFREVPRYVAGEGAPRLDRLGGTTWQRNRRKASESIRRLAEELLQLYAQREALPGRAVPPPEEIYRAFEASFPFTETPDQLQAIEQVVEDMTRPQPMDRLICGDVGYGKTEVALRAAVLAVLGGKQVALLAPTTVLVEQHLHTFTERLRNFPLRVAGLSRFRARGAQQRILEGVAAGEVDIVIGTHRILSRDVRFQNLGLVIIDEEQRFGVAHKERLKQMRTQVDVLTLTATPIPRTLHMGLMGLRDLSLIATPPVDRLAVRTYVSATSPRIIQDGVERELARGGQVFFVVPHIGAEPVRRGGSADAVRGSLAWWAEEIQRLVPRARVAVAHGQLEERTLERTMSEFVAGRSDVLCCTSIVESGLDIPRANTLFVQEADRFGLAQLYQLRGRIGRGRHRAYCFLMVESLSGITSEARQRLEALQRFSDLGAGFHLASADLEIRGAGELLGAKQSGSILAVGFEEYLRIMEEAVAELQGEPLHREADPELLADIPSYIPDDYVFEAGHRLHFYRRFSDVQSEEDADGIVREMTDRFGPPPDEVIKLAGLMAIKAYGRRLKARAVELFGKALVLVLDDSTSLSPAKIMTLLQEEDSPYVLTPDFRLRCRVDAADELGRLELAKKSLQHLMACVR